jgi:hypothetical protein
MKKGKKNEPASTIISITPNVKDFRKFKFLSERNRTVDETQVKKLMDSFSTYGTASTKITIVKSKAFSGKDELFTADGQHTMVAATRLGLGVNVFVVRLAEDTPLNVTKYIAALNNNSKAWSTNNFLTAFANNGIYEYKKLADVKIQHGLTITDLLYIYLGGGSTKENKMFKNGTLNFIDEADSDKLLMAVVKVKNVIPNKAYVRRSLYKMMRMTNDYDKFAKAIIVAANALKVAQSKFSENEAEFTEHLVRIYQQEFKNISKAA